MHPDAEALVAVVVLVTSTIYQMLLRIRQDKLLVLVLLPWLVMMAQPIEILLLGIMR